MSQIVVALEAHLQDRIRALEDRLSTAERENERLRHMAYLDELTGIANRRCFLERLASVTAYAQRYGGAVSLLMIDLDGMKRVNDSAGHEAGDVALRRVAEILHSSVRASDLSARLGGDEFALILPGTSMADAGSVAERVRARIEALELGAGRIMSASFGVATVDTPTDGALAARQLVAQADSALYAAKRSGRNRVVSEQFAQCSAA